MFEKILSQQIHAGRLELYYPDGHHADFGADGAAAIWRVNDRAALARIAADPEYELGATYVEGGWDSPDLASLLILLMRNFRANRSQRLSWARRALRAARQMNRAVQARQQIAHHYDLDEALFRRFLDRDMHYSCAYFREPELSLESAQQAKCAHLAAKLALTPGMRVLDIGSGWGGLALYLARHHDVDVTGVTLSREQWRVSNDRARSLGLAHRVQFLYEDYREHQGNYDRVVSVGMFEHVGIPNYQTFFDQVRARLTPQGVALLHHIGRPGPPGDTNPWIRRHIFPGGYNPALSEVSAPIERSGLWITDVEIWRLHYAQTLREWGRRFQAARSEIAAEKGEHFARMWEFYLAACEAAFAVGDLVIFQIQLAASLATLPLTRDYVYETGPVAAVSRRA
ncbi:MAG TPA: cyclopropane-fatty-acyl-phospholipid synthase family protein [Acidiferrobacteraceae bacterium]|nr:cyclopropane-fatty-acyl-phospholipid synthase family protein [Acidiferrobacteraceae bacterium]